MNAFRFSIVSSVIRMRIAAVMVALSLLVSNARAGTL